MLLREPRDRCLLDGAYP